jgi:hypothetical protein
MTLLKLVRADSGRRARHGSCGPDRHRQSRATNVVRPQSFPVFVPDVGLSVGSANRKVITSPLRFRFGGSVFPNVRSVFLRPEFEPGVESATSSAPPLRLRITGLAGTPLFARSRRRRRRGDNTCRRLGDIDEAFKHSVRRIPGSPEGLEGGGRSEGRLQALSPRVR